MAATANEDMLGNFSDLSEDSEPEADSDDEDAAQVKCTYKIKIFIPLSFISHIFYI